MNRIATRAKALILFVLVLVGGFSFFLAEFVSESGNWILFPGSPHVYNGTNIGCGVVVDRNGTLLLDMTGERSYSNLAALRKATVHWLGDRYGSISAPALSQYAEAMAGYSLAGGVYSYGDTGSVAELTLSASMQLAALEAMDGYNGTVAVYNYKTGQLLCAVTTPTYDPDDVPSEALEGMYLNRFTQASYIPGSIFKVVTLAAALEEIPDIAEQTFVCTGSYKIGSEEIVCEDPHWEQSLKSAFRNSCNCAFGQIALQLGAEKLESYVEKFGVVKSVSFDGITTQTGNFRAVGEADLNVAWSAIGQHLDQINPCAYLTFMGAIANDGVVTSPYLVEKITAGGKVLYDAVPRTEGRIMSQNTAAILQEYLRYNVIDKYGAEHFPGLTVGAKTGTAEVGGDRKPNAMLAGVVENEELPLTFIVCVEDGGYGRTTCIPIVAKILEEAKKVLN